MKVFVAAALLLLGGVCSVCTGVYAYVLMCLLSALLRHTHTEAREGHPISSSVTVQLFFFFFEQVSLTECEVCHLAVPAGQ